MNHFEKYDTHPSRALVGWSWVQLVAMLLLMFFLFNQIAVIGFPGMFWYGGFLFVSVCSYTTLMDKSRWALLTEALRAILGLWLVWWQGGDWFGLGQMGSYFVAGFLLVSLAMAVYFSRTEIPSQKPVSA